jgi:hypothetical protein
VIITKLLDSYGSFDKRIALNAVAVKLKNSRCGLPNSTAAATRARDSAADLLQMVVGRFSKNNY